MLCDVGAALPGERCYVMWGLPCQARGVMLCGGCPARREALCDVGAALPGERRYVMWGLSCQARGVT